LIFELKRARSWKSRPLVNADAFLLTNRGSEAFFRCQVSGVRVIRIKGETRRSSNSVPDQLAEKNDDGHIRNKIEGVNRARGEASETIHHLFMA